MFILEFFLVLTMDDLIKINGAYGEGGGQIIRTALGLSVLTGKGFEATDIRYGRKVAGLKAQHLHAIKAFEKLYGIKCEGAELGSSWLRVIPGKTIKRNISIDIGTAGSVTLVLQSLLLPALLSGGKFQFKIQGGTNVAWSMPVEYVQEVLIPQLRRFGGIDFKLKKRGYYPKGGGIIEVKIRGEKCSNLGKMNQIALNEQGHLIQIKGVSHASLDLQGVDVAERQARAAKQVLLELGIPVNIRIEYNLTESTGSGITLWAIFSKQEDDIDVVNPIMIGADELGKLGKPAEIVGEQAAKKLMREIESGSPVDEHLADNLVLFIALCGGQMKVSRISNHTLTNIYVIEKFLGNIINIDVENRIIKNNN